jgi:hypothetical protein
MRGQMNERGWTEPVPAYEALTRRLRCCPQISYAAIDAWASSQIVYALHQRYKGARFETVRMRSPL